MVLDVALVLCCQLAPAPPDASGGTGARPARAQETPAHELPPVTPRWEPTDFPEVPLYRTYFADPRQSLSGTIVQSPIDNERDNLTIENILGGYRPLVRLAAPEVPDEAIELAAEAAAFSRFDISQDWDMDAADYRFGFPIAYRKGDVTMKLHPWHTTSHLGDEYISRENAKASRYHRDEAALGFSWDAVDALRLYGELGYGFYTGTPNKNDHMRYQLGGEYVWEGSPAPYAAVDMQIREEADYNVDVSAQLGIWVRPKLAPRGFRIAAQYYRGRSAQTQFIDRHDHYVSLGLYMHF